MPRAAAKIKETEPTAADLLAEKVAQREQYRTRVEVIKGEADAIRRRLRDGLAPASKMTPAEYHDDFADATTTIATLDREAALLKRALPMLDGEIRSLEAAAARDIAETLRAEHTAAVAKIAAALDLLVKANTEEAEVRSRIPAAGEGVLKRSAFPYVGTVASPGPEALWLAAVVKAGILPAEGDA